MAWDVKRKEIMRKLEGIKIESENITIVFTYGDADWNYLQNNPQKWWKTEGVERVIFDARGKEWIEGGTLLWGEKKKIPYMEYYLGRLKAVQRMGEFYSVNVYAVPKDKTSEFISELIEKNDGTITAIGKLDI